MKTWYVFWLEVGNKTIVMMRRAVKAATPELATDKAEPKLSKRKGFIKMLR
jgi:hypothetical protein